LKKPKLNWDDAFSEAEMLRKALLQGGVGLPENMSYRAAAQRLEQLKRALTKMKKHV
jgi:hypothetical protein